MRLKLFIGIMVFICMTGLSLKASADDTQQSRLYKIPVKIPTPVELRIGNVVIGNYYYESNDPESFENEYCELIRNSLGLTVSEMDVLSDNQIRITASPENHKVVRMFLDDFDSLVSRRIEVKAWLICIDTPKLAGLKLQKPLQAGVSMLTREQLSGLIKQSDFTRDFEFKLAQAQTGVSRSAKETVYTCGYNVEIAAGSATPRPILAAFAEGAGLKVTPYINFSGNMIRLDMSLMTSKLRDEMEIFENAVLVKINTTKDVDNLFSMTSGSVELPDEDAMEYATTIYVPSNGIVIAGYFEADSIYDGKSVLLVVNPEIEKSIFNVKGAVQVKREEEQRWLYDCNALLKPYISYRPLQDWPWGLDLYEFDNRGRFPIDEERSVFQRQLFKENMGDMFSGFFFEDFYWDTGIVPMVFNNASLPDEFSDRVIAIESNMQKIISIDAVYCKVPEALYQDSMSIDDKVKRAGFLLNAISGNPGPKFGSYNIAGCDNQTFGGYAFERKSIVSDHDVELASGIVAYTAVIGSVYDGTSLQVRPLIMGSNKINCDVNTFYRKFKKDIKVFEMTPGYPRYHQPVTTEYRFLSNIVLDNNVWDYIAFPQQDEDEGHIIILLKASVR